MLYDSDQEYCVNSPTKYDKNEQENRKSRKSSDRKWEGKEEGREGGAICIFLESPALMNGATIFFSDMLLLSQCLAPPTGRAGHTLI